MAGSDMKKKMLDIVRRVEDIPGWQVTPTKGGHLKFTNPQGRSCFAPSTPSDYRGLRNVARDLRKLGLVGFRI